MEKWQISFLLMMVQTTPGTNCCIFFQFVAFIEINIFHLYLGMSPQVFNVVRNVFDQY